MTLLPISKGVILILQAAVCPWSWSGYATRAQYDIIPGGSVIQFTSKMTRVILSLREGLLTCDLSHDSNSAIHYVPEVRVRLEQHVGAVALVLDVVVLKLGGAPRQEVPLPLCCYSVMSWDFTAVISTLEFTSNSKLSQRTTEDTTAGTTYKIVIQWCETSRQ